MTGATPRLRPRHDIVVVGGGPAGSALAALLAAQGRDVALLEKDTFPRDKLCGEFLSTESKDLLGRLGCLDVVLDREPERIRTSRFFSPSGRRAVLDLPGEALSLSRAAFDRILFEHAARSGAVALEGTEVRALRPGSHGTTVELAEAEDGPASVEAGLTVAAYGRRSPLDRRLGRGPSGRKHPYLGLKRHHRPIEAPEGERLRSELRGAVEVHVFDGGYGGLSFVEEGRVNACFLLEKRLLQRLGAPLWDGLRRALPELSPSLHRRMRALAPVDAAVQAVAEISFDLKETHRGPVLFVGDAAAMIAPLCGDGQAMALRSAELLAGILQDLQAAPEGLGPLWDRRWRAEFGFRLRLGRAIQRILLRPAACDAALRVVELFPALGARLVQATRGA